MSSKILILEDNTLFCETLEDFLEEEGFEVYSAHNSDQALELSYTHKFDMYLLDINIPIMSGLELLDELRQSGDNTPAIFLTSYQDKEIMKEGFLKGCDDYLKKPIDLQELNLRMLSVIRRVKGKQRQCIGDICIDIEQKRLFKANLEIELSLREFELIALLFRYKGDVVSKEKIFEALWRYDSQGSDGAVRVYINRVKKILGSQNIKNIRGIGYQYLP